MKYHIVFDGSAEGNLKGDLLLKSKDRVITLKDDLSVGPIRDIDKKSGLAKRKEWWKMVLKGRYDIELIRDKIKELLNKRENLIFWVGSNSLDELGFMRLIYNHKDNLYNQISIVKFPKQGIKFKSKNGKILFAKSLGEFHPEYTKQILKKYKRELSKTEIKRIILEWKRLSSSNSILRIRKDNWKYQSQSEDYYDKKLLSICKEEHQPAYRIIGTLIGKEGENHINIDFLIWRLRELVNLNKLQFTGNFENIRNLKIKKKTKN